MLNNLHAWNVVCILSHLRLQTFMPDELAHLLNTCLDPDHNPHDSALTTQYS